MGDLAIVSEAVHRFGDSAIALGKHTMEVGNVDQAAIIAAAIPVYGLIGQDFVVTLATAQANHLSAVAELAAVYAAIGGAAHDGPRIERLPATGTQTHSQRSAAHDRHLA